MGPRSARKEVRPPRLKPAQVPKLGFPTHPAGARRWGKDSRHRWLLFGSGPTGMSFSSGEKSAAMFGLPALASGGADTGGQCRREFTGFEPEWARLAFIGNATVPVDEINSIRPPGISGFGGVAKFVQHRGEFDPQLANAGARYKRTLFLILRTGKDDLVFDVALHLPNIAGVSFRDVHDKEIHFALILIVELVEGGNLPPERRSSITAKDQYRRPAVVQLC